MTDQAEIDDLLRREQLPASYGDFARRHIGPLAQWLQQRAAAHDGPLLVGVHGAQGTGKTTLSRFLALMLPRELHCLTLSLDDFYLGSAARRELAARVHPLLQTRGVPGTHDIPLLNDCLDRLLAGELPPLPRFDKGADDRVPEQEWRPPGAAPGIILLEGWCIAAPPQPDAALASPANDLERAEDADGAWRGYVNDQLRGDYARLFARLDLLVMLRAPSMEAVLRWRELQESKLRAHGGAAVMSATQVERFVQHYERITRHCLEALPSRADYLFALDENHDVAEVTQR